MHLILLFIIMFGSLLPNTQAAASVFVTLRDINEAGIPHIIVIVRDAQGQNELARGQTDAKGELSFFQPLTAPLRIAVEGRLPHGIPLYQDGFDADGVLIHEVPLILDLRVEPDGKVIPDPVTMITQDDGWEAPTSQPETPLLSTAPIATRLPSQALVPTPAVLQPARTPSIVNESERPPTHWAGALLLTLLLGACVGLFLLQSRWRGSL